MSTAGVRSSMSSRIPPSQWLLATAKGPLPPVWLTKNPHGSCRTTLHGNPEFVTRDQLAGTTPASNPSDNPLCRYPGALQLAASTTSDQFATTPRPEGESGSRPPPAA